MERLTNASEKNVISTNEKIAIVGAGPVGISAARALKMKGIAYDQFESESAVGGNWRHGVYKTAHIISSKKTNRVSEFSNAIALSGFSQCGSNAGVSRELFQAL